ncbi:3-oxoacyl-ACP synthase [Actinomadura sp. KC216]|uniref:3-oxoacyl-ACP synthase III family protein n=1 Tax=Actinomadura sp. KC216 TaxID=2530370 RepID=UPI001045E316|nr:3-oxoacyl-[acyl-carrier-protein] synthase III C-terminal domain-containing protein [Actinomadura sp. KC216]TDB91175.1 3-oxoacyl-ACP synthase [Actinomadura sp. KC216]
MNQAQRQQAGILGCGHSLPQHVRRNDDPVFAGMDRSRNPQGIYQSHLFRGLDRRYYLKPGESLTELMAESCRRALAAADLEPAAVDRLYGYATAPRYLTPNPLYELHHLLGLRPDAAVMPINTEFTNFISGLIQASEAINSGTAQHCLVAVGNNWSQHLDYTQGHATSVGDAAGSVIVGPSPTFAIIDHASRTLSSNYHALTLGVRPIELTGRSYLPVDPATLLPLATIDINQSGVEALGSVIKDGLPELVRTLLDRNGIRPDETMLITHQGIRPLLDHWRERIQPKEHLETLALFGNLITATYPVNLSHFFDQISTEYLVMAGIGAGMHITGVVLRRTTGDSAALP